MEFYAVYFILLDSIFGCFHFLGSKIGQLSRWQRNSLGILVRIPKFLTHHDLCQQLALYKWFHYKNSTAVYSSYKISIGKFGSKIGQLSIQNFLLTRHDLCQQLALYAWFHHKNSRLHDPWESGNTRRLLGIHPHLHQLSENLI